MKKALCLLSVLCSVGFMQAHVVLDEDICTLFNKITVRHLEAIGFALAQPDICPDVDPSHGLAAWWQSFMINGGIKTVLLNENVCALGRAWHAQAKQNVLFKNAFDKAISAESNKALEQEKEYLWHQVGIAFVDIISDELALHGCVIKRPASHKDLYTKPGSGGTYPATQEKSWGDLQYLTNLMQANADLDAQKQYELLCAFAVAQLLLRSELKSIQSQ